MFNVLIFLVFIFCVIISYIILNKLFFNGRVINRIYTYIKVDQGNKVKRKVIKGKHIHTIKNLITRINKKITKHNRTKTRHYRKFNDQLGDAITIISNSLKAGHSFTQALDTLVTEMPAPLSSEFGQVIREVRLGKTLEKSLENLLERIPSKDLELMLTAILMQRETGGNLAEVLDIISETIRERLKLSREIKTLTAQGKLSAIIVLVLPIAIGGIMFVMSPDYIMELFINKAGILMIVMGIFAELIGMFFINKIIKIDV
ncbi:MAG TPA: hypothetical protein DCP90_09060 [Clostridiales bacterium]|nr:MAG: hypothetical protein A2Y22_02830 [Clostridiales bacterium GWD2_32_59]HAN10743.1 hypothetical protein [Clostridiales bacterium]